MEVRLFIHTFFVIALVSSVARADQGSFEESSPELQNKFLMSALGREDEAAKDKRKLSSNQESTRDLLTSLAKEVDALNSKLIVERASLLTTQTPRRVQVNGRRTVFHYLPNSIYEITSSPNHITDIELAPGEQITKEPLSGDTVRWKVGVLKSGKGKQETTHIILKPLDENIETNFVIATDERVYHLRVRSSDWHMPSVSWNYPADTSKEIEEAIKKSEVEPGVNLQMLNFDYEIKGEKIAWKPIRVFDDGQKTYIQMPDSMRSSDAPALFLIEDETKLLTNYRWKGLYIILDRLLDQAELRVGSQKCVTIISARVQKGFFERLFE
jgi:type IV secretion system protein TrbG